MANERQKIFNEKRKGKKSLVSTNAISLLPCISDCLIKKIKNLV